EPGAIRETDGLEFLLGARYLGAHSRRRMAVARTVSGAFTCFDSRWGRIYGNRRAQGALAGILAYAPEGRSRASAERSRPSHGIQDHEVRRVQESLVAIDVAPGESRDLPPGSSHDHVAAAGHRANSDRPDALLSGTRDCGEGVNPAAMETV